MEEIEFESLYQETPTKISEFCDAPLNIWSLPTKLNIVPAKQIYDQVKLMAMGSNVKGAFPILLSPSTATLTKTEETYKSADVFLEVQDGASTLFSPNLIVQGNQEIFGDIIVHGQINGNYKGSVTDPAQITSLKDYKQGLYWLVEEAGHYVGEDCEAGDIIYCVNNFSGLYKIDDFKVLQTNVSYILNNDIDILFNNLL